MPFIRFAIENPVKVAVGVILLALFGTLSIFAIPIQLTPDVDAPVIKITTRWSGASPQEMESEVVDRQEEKLKSVANLRKMTSVSQESEATIRLEFPVGVNKDVAFRDVSDKLRQVTDYPDEMDEPVMSATDDEFENIIGWMILSSKDGRDVATLKTFIEDQVKPILERAEGISEVDVYGGLDREIQVEVDPYLLAARGLTFRDVEAALRRQNANVSAGTIAEGKRDYSYRTVGEFRSIEDVENTVVAYQQGGPVLIRDVAKAIDGFKKQYAFVRSHGQYVIALPARRETGANVIEAMRNLREQIDKVNREVLSARGLNMELNQVYDQTVYIWDAIWLVFGNLAGGGVLAVIVLWLFLRSFSATGIVAVSIPIAVVGTFLMIAMLGRTLNVIMLAGIAFAVGNSVDNFIVVLENVYRHRGMGKSRKQAALDGSSEVWGAVFASTMTTLAVFLPVVFIQEEAGQLFKDIAIASVAAAALSFVVAFVVIPPLTSRFFSGSKAMELGDKPSKLGTWVASLVRLINRHVYSRVITVFGLSALAFIGSWLLLPGTEYLPGGNENLVFGMLFSPPGYSIDEYRKMAVIVEEGDPNDPKDGVRPFWEAALGTPQAEQLTPIDIAVGRDRKEIRSIVPPPIDNFFFVTFAGSAFMGCTSEETTNVKPLEKVLERAGSRVPGVFTFFRQASLFSGGETGNSVDLEIRGEDLSAVVSSASALMGRILGAGYGYPQPSPANFDKGRPEVQLIPDRVKAADLGLDVRDVGFIVEACIDGAFVGEFNDRGDKIDIALTVSGTAKATHEEIGQIPIATPSGHVVPIASAIELRRTTAPQQINHIEEMNSVTLAVNSRNGVPLQDTMRELQEGIIAPLRAEGKVSPLVTTVLAGTADKLTQTQKALIGDFEGTVTRPQVFGLSVGWSLAVTVALLAALTVTARMFGGKRAAAIAGLFALITFAIVFLAMNPALFFALANSRAFLALLITYLLMAGLYESFAYPFVIMFSVPPAVVGGFLAIRVVHEISLYDVKAQVQQLDVLTMLGFIILIGIVVNNAILIVHQALIHLREDGLPPDDAVALAVQIRTRPIFMTMTTAIFGLAPMVISPGAGSELYRGLGAVLLGGLLFSTVFTLVVVPAMFTLFLDFQTWFRAALRPADTAQTTSVFPSRTAIPAPANPA
jgi:HAE1 family hydrophobic/amphiphilic exporter-1